MTSLLLSTAGLACVAERESAPDLGTGEDPSEARRAVSAGDANGLHEAPVYSVRRVSDREGSILEVEESGLLPREIADRAARPWLYRAEPLVYGDDAWSIDRPDGSIERGYRVFSRPNLNPWTRPATRGVPELGEPLLTRLDFAALDEMITIIVEMRNYAEWDIPLRSTTAPSSPEEDAAAVESRANAIQLRKTRYAEMAAPIEAQIRQLALLDFA